MPRYSGPSPATVASANRFSRVAEGFLNQLMLPTGKRRSAEYERFLVDARRVRLSRLPRQHLPLRRQRALCRGDVRKLPQQSRQRARQLALVFRCAAARAGHRRQHHPRRPAPAGHQCLCRAREAGHHEGGAGQRRRFRAGPQAHRRPAADRGLPQRRRPLGRSRSAEAHGAPADPGTRALVLRLHRWRPRNGVQHQQHLLRQGDDVSARSAQRAARDLLRHHRRRVHVHDRPGPEALVAAEARKRADQSQAERRAEEAHPRPPDGRRRPGALPAHQVRRPEALLARRRRELHRLDGRTDQPGRRQGRTGNRDRHGPPRAPQRAGQFARQDAGRPVRRVRPHGPRRPAQRRREVPPGLQLRRVDPRRPGAPDAWPSIPRTSRS